MLLTIDIGNTNIKWILFDEENILEKEVFSTHSAVQFPQSILQNTSEIAVSSVNPLGLSKIINYFSLNTAITANIINYKSPMEIIVDYETPETLGADRICAANAIFTIARNSTVLTSKSLIISCDFGTANNISIVQGDGIFLGGLIAPGIKLMTESLHNRTASLPLTQTTANVSLIGKSTSGAILSGVFYSAAGFVNNMVNEIKNAMDPDKIIIFTTGGNYLPIKPFIKFEHIFRENLVCEGIRFIHKHPER